MEKETTNEYNIMQENPIILEENKSEIQQEQEVKKLSLSDINPSDLTSKIENFFSNKLEIYETKFQADLVSVEPIKYQFIDLYHELENLKQEILDFLKKEEEKKTTKKSTGSTITRNNTSRSRTPIKFNATASKLASTRDVTKSANKKNDLDKSRSKTPLTKSKISKTNNNINNDKSKKDISVSKTETKKNLNLNTTATNYASTVNTTRANITAKKTTFAETSSAKKRDITPASSTKLNKALDTSVISHNEPSHTEHGNSSNTAKKANLNKSAVKTDIKANVASAKMKKPAIAAEAGASSKRKSALNLTATEGQVTSFSSSIDLNKKKKSLLATGLNTSDNSDIAQNTNNAHNNYASHNNLEISDSNNNNTARASFNKTSGKGERKASVPAQRGSLNSANKRNSVDKKQENINKSLDEEKRDHEVKAEEKNEETNKPVERRISVEIKKIEDETQQKENEANQEKVKKEENEANENNNSNSKLDENDKNQTRRSINDIEFENGKQEDKVETGEKDEIKKNISETNISETTKNDSQLNNKDQSSVISPNEKRMSLKLQEQKQEEKAESNQKIYVSEKAENDIKVAEERKQSLIAESVSISNLNANQSDYKQEENKAYNLNDQEEKTGNEIQIQVEVPDQKKEETVEIKTSQCLNNKSFLLSFVNKKNCALYLCIKSGLLTIKDQISLIYCNKELKNNQLAETKEDLFIFLKDKITEYENLVTKYKSDLANLTIINKQLVFSKTAVNGLNFVKKEEENNLLKKEQNEKIVDVFKFFCILLNEKYENLPVNKIIEYFMLTILPKYKLESLKKFVSEYIPNNILNFDFNLENLLEFVNKHHHILVSNELLSLNRSVSYVTFSNKEIFEFLSAKLNDGNYAYNCKRANGLIKKYSEILNKLGQ